MKMQTRTMTPARVAIMIDGDNLSTRFASRVMQLAEEEGCVGSVRVYGEAEKCQAWRQLAGVRFIDAGKGKNAADVLLCIETLTQVANRGYDTICLASSDGDFRHLAFALREADTRVVGLGDAHAPETFRKACSAFKDLSVSAITSVDEMAMNVKRVIEENTDDDRGALVTTVSQKMLSKHDVRISKTPYKSWRSYFNGLPKLFDLDPKGPSTRVRLRPVLLQT